MSPSMIDTILNNRYRLDAIIGEGGMAVVYRGYDLLLRRQVAVKVLRPAYASDESFVQRFYEEARAAANLSHPNIVNTYDVGQVDGSHYIVEEFVAGETLAAIIARQGKLPESIAVRYARQIALALGAAHRAELLHRDIKPSNVLITTDDVVRVTDFGIARAANAATLSGVEAIMGSIPYCSPEQLSGGALTPASDLYSLGVVLYEMTTGKRPYDAETALGVAMAHVNAPIPDPVANGADISPQLQHLILRLLQKSAADRFASAGEALAALRRCLRQSDDDAVDAGSNETATAVLRRRAPRADAAREPGESIAPVPVWSVRRALGWAAAALGLIVVLAMVFAARKAASQDLTVPDLSGKSQVDAIAALHAMGVDSVTFRQRADNVTPAGLVDGSQPAAAAPIRRGDAIILYLSAGPERVRVPDVIGKDLKTATALLKAAGFGVRAGKAVHSASVHQGLVAQVNPGPDTPAPKGSTVALSQSLGPQTVRVPNIVSLNEDDARAALARVGLKLQPNAMTSVDIPAHTVIDQDPAAGSNVQPGATVNADVSGGPNAITVPNVVGTSVGDARATLEQSGLTVGRIAQAVVSDTSPGTVVSQDPAANAQAPQGSAVDIVVAAAPAAQRGQASPAPGSSPGGDAAVPVPNVLGMSVDEARAALEKAGYHVDHVTVLPGSSPNAKVSNTEPEPGATLPPGSSAVNLIVGPK